MNDKETYGIELELITEKFKNKIKSLTNTISKAKKDFTIGLNYDSLSESRLKTATDKIKKRIDDLQRKSESLSLFPKADKEIDEITAKIEKLAKERDSLKITTDLKEAGGVTNLTGQLATYTDQARADELSEQISLYYEQLNALQKSKQLTKGQEEELKRINTELAVATKNYDANKAILERTTLPMTRIGKIVKSTKVVVGELKNSFSNLSPYVNSFKEKLTGAFSKFKKDNGSFKSSISSAFTKGISSIKRFGVALLGVRGIYGLLSKAVHSYLSDHENIKNQFNAMIAGIGNLLAPAIEYVLNIVSKLLSYANAFIKMLTGVDLFAKGMASINKSAKSTAKSVNDIKGGLAGIDEITNIANDSASNNPSGDVSLLPNVDLKPLEKLKDYLSKIFEPFEKAWNKTKDKFIKSVKNMITKVGGMFESIGGSFLEVWTNGTGEKILENIIGLFTNIFDIVGNIGQAIKLAWDYEGNGTTIIQNIADTFNAILDYANEIGDSLKKWTASEGFQTALKRISTFCKDITGYIKDIATWLVDMYKKYFKPVVDEAILPSIDAVITAIGDVWNAIKPVVDKIIEILKNYVEPKIEKITDMIKGISTALKGVCEFISGVFTGDWKKAWQGVLDTFTGIWEGLTIPFAGPLNFIIDGVEAFINGIIGAFNKAKKVLRLIGIDVEDTNYVHITRIGEKYTVTANSPIHGAAIGGITKYATGTNYVERDGLAYLHQGEAVVPEKFNDREYFGNDEETKDLLRQLIETVEDKDMNAYIDEDAIGKSATNYINNQSRMLGRSVIS